MKRSAAIINRAVLVATGIEFDDTASVCTNGDTNKRCIRLSLPSIEAIAIAVLDLACLRVTSEIRFELERAWSISAVILNGKLATVTSVITGCMLVRSNLLVDSLAHTIDGCEAVVMANPITGRTRNCMKSPDGHTTFKCPA